MNGYGYWLSCRSLVINGWRVSTRRSMWIFEVDRFIILRFFLCSVQTSLTNEGKCNTRGLSYRGVPDGLIGFVP